jgi:hypothetical protein
MSTQKPTNIQPICEVPNCKEGAQILSLTGTTATWMQTCYKHSYQDLPAERLKIETFWPPETS